MSCPPLIVTGARGFVGRRLLMYAHAHGWTDLRGVSRTAGGGLYGIQSWSGIAEPELDGLFHHQGIPPVVVHLAARAHILNDDATDPPAAFKEANVDLAVEVARAAFQRGVVRFVFVSSIGAVGDATEAGEAFSEESPCRPQSDYGRAKWQAEQVLRGIAAEAGRELVIVRPPLVYGPGAPGNMRRLARLARYPLPLGAIHNQRSLIHIDNLCAALLLCARHPAAAGQLFHVRDARDYSTPEILEAIAHAQGRRARLFPMPPGWLERCARWAGRLDDFRKLTFSLQCRDDRIRSLLGYDPRNFPFDVTK